MLEGKQFFSWEIADVLNAAVPGSAAALEADRLANLDTALESPPLYRAGSPLWSLADRTLLALAGSAQVAALIAGLPSDPNPPASSWLLPALGVAAAGALAYWWTNR